jgi:hypothetical protein
MPRKENSAIVRPGDIITIFGCKIKLTQPCLVIGLFLKRKKYVKKK